MELTSTSALLAALSMIGWSKPAFHRLLEMVIANDQGADAGTILSEREVHKWTGISRTLIYKYFDELVCQQLLLRFDGGGPRGHAYRVNPRVREWLVPWFSEKAPKMDTAPSRAWLRNQEIALGRIHRFVHPELGHKTRTVARPVGALTRTAARPGGALWGATGTPGRATVDPLVAHPVARLDDSRDGATQLSSIEEPLSLTHEQRERGRKLQATIREQSGAEVWGRLADEIVALGCDTNIDRAITRVAKAPPGLSIVAYQKIAEAALTEPERETVAPPKMWEPPPAEPKTVPPWIAAGQSRDEWLRSCKTDAGGNP